MKEITAVQCKECKKLIPADYEYLIANTIAITQKYTSGQLNVKCAVNDEVFCDSECVTKYIQGQIKDF